MIDLDHYDYNDLQVLEIFYENYKRQGDQTKNFVFHPGPNKLVSFHHKHMLAFITFIIKIILDIWRYVYDIWFREGCTKK